MLSQTAGEMQHAFAGSSQTSVWGSAGVLFFGFVISSLSDLISHMGGTARRAVLLRQKAEDVEAWLQLRQVPRGLGARITAYFSDAWVRYAGERMKAQLLRPSAMPLFPVWKCAVAINSCVVLEHGCANGCSTLSVSIVCW